MCSALRSKSRIQFEGVSVIVPPVAKHPCKCRHQWNSNPTQGPFVKSMAIHLGHFTVISLAEKVTTLYSVLPDCQGGPTAQSLKSITILDRTSVTPISNINGVAGGASGCKWKQQYSPSDFHQLKKSARGDSMMRLCYQWTFTSRNLLGIGSDRNSK